MAGHLDCQIGAQIRRHRVASNLTMTELGASVGCTGAQIGKYETGIDRVSASRLYRIAQRLRRPIDEFMPDDGPDPSPANGQEAKHTIAMYRACDQVTDPRLRGALIKLARALAP